MASSVQFDSVVQSTRRCRLGGIIGAGTLALVLFLASLPVSAQVVIRESVDLSEPSATADAPESLGGHTVSFVALRDGFLSVFYGSIQRAGSQYPAGQPTLEVYRDGVLAGTDDVLSHTWPPPVPIQRNCGGLYDEYNYNTTETIDLQIPILTGETISFLFKSDQDTYGDDPGEGGTAPSGDQWSVAIGGFDPSCPFPLELFQFFA